MPGVVVGISGGVDSAVCAARLLKQGFDVTGVFLNVNGGSNAAAQSVCGTLGIPLVTVDAREQLERLVIQPFAQGYREGITPNPCVICNPMVKYPILLKAADSVGAEYIATGHYAGTVKVDGRLYLRRGAEGRDQSYMLYRLSAQTLERCLFPVGDSPKDGVRREAAALGLEAADSPDSMEICFIPDGDFAAYNERMGYGTPEGDIVDTEGNILGRHRGLHCYTVGQRRGLGIPAGVRMFVVDIDTADNRVVLGCEDLLYKKEIQLRDVVWTHEREGRVEVRIRHSRIAYPAEVEVDRVLFTEGAARAPSPGQSAVFYRDGLVLGGGIIC